MRGMMPVAWFRVGLALASASCGSPPPHPPNPTRPLDERRAVELILKAFTEENETGVTGQTITLAGGKLLRVDVTAAGKRYGVAFVTGNDRRALGLAVPTAQPGMEDALHLMRGTQNDADARILVLQDTDYLYDDQVGEEHEETVVTAENKLDRDVRDFIVRAHVEKWP
ncbi:MAG TPA: hypothetical protein VHU80_22320 [Polyangiaceae bacterium]|jgi:hypothetical protein|nr:hypothetical protein [Polyangiaceae bacterium]